MDSGPRMGYLAFGERCIRGEVSEWNGTGLPSKCFTTFNPKSLTPLLSFLHSVLLDCTKI